MSTSIQNIIPGINTRKIKESQIENLEIQEIWEYRNQEDEILPKSKGNTILLGS